VGAFTLRNGTAGDYVVIVSPGFEKGYVKSIQLGSFDVLNDGLHAGNTPDGEMVIVIGTNPGAVAGVARDENGAPQSNVTIALFPDESHRNRIDLYQSVISDAAGDYRFQRWRERRVAKSRIHASARKSWQGSQRRRRNFNERRPRRH